jgi:hypothetical protein
LDKSKQKFLFLPNQIKIIVEKGWVKIFQTTELYKIEIIKSMLEEHEIMAVVFNKIDSSYLSFGELELYVAQEDIIRAIQLIKDNQ